MMEQGDFLAQLVGESTEQEKADETLGAETPVVEEAAAELGELLTPVEETAEVVESIKNTDTDETEEEVDIVKQQQKQIDLLLEQITKLTTPPVESVAAVEPKVESTTTAPVAVKTQDFTDDDLQDALSSVSNFRSFLSKFSAGIREETLTAVMPAVAIASREESRRNVLALTFYRENADLVESKQLVGVVANGLKASNPTWDDEKVLDETAKTVRSMTKKAPLKEAAKPAIVGLPKTSSSRIPPSNPLSREKQLLANLLNFND